jgi:hypothetical protein
MNIGEYSEERLSIDGARHGPAAPDEWSQEGFAARLGFAEDLGGADDAPWDAHDSPGFGREVPLPLSPAEAQDSAEHLPSEPSSTPELQPSDTRSSSELTMPRSAPPTSPTFGEPAAYPVQIAAAAAPALAPRLDPALVPKSPTTPRARPARATGPSAFEKVMSKTRPVFLPPKDKAEDTRHLADWEEMMKLSRAAGERRVPVRLPPCLS